MFRWHLKQEGNIRNPDRACTRPRKQGLVWSPVGKVLGTRVQALPMRLGALDQSHSATPVVEVRGLMRHREPRKRNDRTSSSRPEYHARQLEQWEKHGTHVSAAPRCKSSWRREGDTETRRPERAWSAEVLQRSTCSLTHGSDGGTGATLRRERSQPCRAEGKKLAGLACPQREMKEAQKSMPAHSQNLAGSED